MFETIPGSAVLMLLIAVFGVGLYGLRDGIKEMWR